MVYMLVRATEHGTCHPQPRRSEAPRTRSDMDLDGEPFMPPTGPMERKRPTTRCIASLFQPCTGRVPILAEENRHDRRIETAQNTIGTAGRRSKRDRRLDRPSWRSNSPTAPLSPRSPAASAFQRIRSSFQPRCPSLRENCSRPGGHLHPPPCPAAPPHIARQLTSAMNRKLLSGQE